MTNPENDVTETIVTAWNNLCNGRLHEELTIRVDGDPITLMMNTLADLANQCMLHFMKLALYQSALNEKLDSEPKTDGSFQTGLPERM